MTFPIKKRISTELFIDTTEALHEVYPVQKCYLDPKDVGMKGQVLTYIKMCLTGM